MIDSHDLEPFFSISSALITHDHVFRSSSHLLLAPSIGKLERWSGASSAPFAAARRHRLALALHEVALQSHNSCPGPLCCRWRSQRSIRVFHARPCRTLSKGCVTPCSGPSNLGQTSVAGPRDVADSVRCTAQRGPPRIAFSFCRATAQHHSAIRSALAAMRVLLNRLHGERRQPSPTLLAIAAASLSRSSRSPRACGLGPCHRPHSHRKVSCGRDTRECKGQIRS